MSAFLNGDLNARNLMKQPLSLSSVWKHLIGFVSHFKVSMALNNQHGNGTKSLTSFSIPSEADPFVYHNLTGSPVILDIFVGDGAKLFYQPGTDWSYSTGFGFSIQRLLEEIWITTVGWKLLSLLTEKSLFSIKLVIYIILSNKFGLQDSDFSLHPIDSGPDSSFETWMMYMGHFEIKNPI